MAKLNKPIQVYSSDLSNKKMSILEWIKFKVDEFKLNRQLKKAWKECTVKTTYYKNRRVSGFTSNAKTK